ncbi:MAG: hypothetical protein BYD32DRAFT_439653 [Podila humilis]|nr:MAG: hypothetical protein BYD32DRAFT_439653 [Podila humilis]
MGWDGWEIAFQAKGIFQESEGKGNNKEKKGLYENVETTDNIKAYADGRREQSAWGVKTRMAENIDRQIQPRPLSKLYGSHIAKGTLRVAFRKLALERKQPCDPRAAHFCLGYVCMLPQRPNKDACLPACLPVSISVRCTKTKNNTNKASHVGDPVKSCPYGVMG